MLKRSTAPRPSNTCNAVKQRGEALEKLALGLAGCLAAGIRPVKLGTSTATVKDPASGQSEICCSTSLGAPLLRVSGLRGAQDQLFAVGQSAVSQDCSAEM